MPLVFFVYKTFVCAKLSKKGCVTILSWCIAVECKHQSFETTTHCQRRAVLREEGGMRQRDGRSHRYSLNTLRQINFISTNLKELL